MSNPKRITIDPEKENTSDELFTWNGKVPGGKERQLPVGIVVRLMCISPKVGIAVMGRESTLMICSRK